MTPPRVAIVHLGRAGGMGGLLRVRSLRAIFEGAGAEVVEVRLRVDHRTDIRNLPRIPLSAVVRGTAVPECLSWSPGSAMAALRHHAPDVVVCETSRAYHPVFADGPWMLVLDYVDRLSISYADRATIVTSAPRRWLFRLLAHTSARFEARSLPAGVHTIAAGWSDAQALRAGWVPITIEVSAQPESRPVSPGPTTDLLFFGNLSYPPNVEAVHRLHRIWPAVVRARPATTLLLAGASPGAELVELAGANGWHLRANFESLPDLLASTRLGVVPLVHASGIQTKALEAAAHGLPQVVDPVVASGFAPEFPFAVARNDAELVEQIVSLLDDHDARATLGRAAQEHMANHYSVAAWRRWAVGLLAS